MPAGVDLARALERSRRLVRLAHELAVSLEPGTTSRLVVRELLEVADAAYAACYLVGSKGLALEAVAGAAPRGALAETPALVERARRRLAATRADVADAAELRERGAPCGSAVAAPLVAQGELLGVVLVACREGLAEPLDPEVVATVADLAAASLANARRFAVAFAEARRDALTGLANHRAFHERIDDSLRHALASGAEVSLVLFDLDDFKRMNDEAGHSHGDRLLRGVARAALRSLRPGEEVFRVGGDEFAIVIEAGRDVGARVAERVATAAAAERRIALPSLSAGVAAFPQDARTKEELLHLADVALYAAKRAGKGRVVGYHRDIEGASGLTRSEFGRGQLGERLARPDVRSVVVAELAAVAEAIAELGRADTPAELVGATARQLALVLGATGCVVSRLDDDVLSTAGVCSPAPYELRPAPGRRVAELVLARAALASGRPAAARADAPDTDPTVRAHLEGAGMASALVLPISVLERPWGVAEVYDVRPRDFGVADLALGELVVAHAGAVLAEGAQADALVRVYRDALASVSNVLGGRDAGTSSHAQDVAALAVAVGRELGLDADALGTLELAALLHDVGLARVPAAVLAKREPLTPDELALVREAADRGAAMLAPVASLVDVLPLLLGVRERWDGTGHPDGLASIAIPLGARILAACEAYSAIAEGAAHRPGLGSDEALGIVASAAGSQFDPRCVEALAAVVLPAMAAAGSR